MSKRGGASPASRFPSSVRRVRDGQTFQVHPADIAPRVFSLAAGVDRGHRLDKQRERLAKGIADPIKMAIDSRGTLEIIDGRHRWIAAVESGRRVRVTLHRSRGIDTSGLVNLR